MILCCNIFNNVDIAFHSFATSITDCSFLTLCSTCCFCYNCVDNLTVFVFIVDMTVSRINVNFIAIFVSISVCLFFLATEFANLEIVALFFASCGNSCVCPYMARSSVNYLFSFSTTNRTF